MAPRNEICLKSENLSEDFFISIVENKLKITRDQFKLIMPFISSNPIKNGSVSFVVYPTEIKIEHNDGRKESVHAVVKSLTGMSEFNKEIGVFAREKMMYEDVVSSFQKIWEEVGVELDFGTRILKTETYPYEILVLDDLGKSGYVLPDRKVGVDLNVSKLLLSKLAKFHAASAVRFLKVSI